MKNHEDMLNQHLEGARQQPSLLSRDEVATLISQQGREPQSNKRLSQGIATTLLAGLGVLALFLLLPEDRREAETKTPNPSTEVLAQLDKSDVERDRGEISQTEDTEAVDLTPPSTRLSNSSEQNEGDQRVVTSPSRHRSQRAETSLNLTQSRTMEAPSISIGDELSITSTQTSTVDSPDEYTLGYIEATPYLQPLPETGKDMVSEKLTVKKLSSLNSYSNDYNPMVTADGRTLYFVSNREHGLGGHDFWVATKEERQDLEFTVPSNLGSSINTSRNEGGATISADGQLMYFTACKRPDGLGECDLYEAHLNETGWVEVRNVREINSEYWESQPTISSDGRSLYFVSNRPGTTGGYEDTDIYVSYKQADGMWSSPQNVGRPINTDQREDSPFIVPGGNALYFSSAGHEGYGGLDFFISHKQENQRWEDPINLGAEFNTPDDERFIAAPAAGDVIYFTKSGDKGKLDLYMARKGTRSTSIVINGSVQNAETKAPHHADLLFVDRATGEIIQHASTNDITEEFSLVLGKNTSQRVIDIFGYNDSLGEFRTHITLEPTDSYREYRCDLVISRSEEQPSTLSTSLPKLAITQLGSREFTITAPEGEEGELEVLDAWDNKLAQQYFLLGEERVIRLESAPEGLYLARLGKYSGIISLQKRND